MGHLFSFICFKTAYPFYSLFHFHFANHHLLGCCFQEAFILISSICSASRSSYKLHILCHIVSAFSPFCFFASTLVGGGEILYLACVNRDHYLVALEICFFFFYFFF